MGLFSFLEVLTETAVKLPFALIKDTVTLGGSLSDEPSAVGTVLENLNDELLKEKE